MLLSKVTLLGLVLLNAAFAQFLVNRPEDVDYYTAAVFEHSRRSNWTILLPAEVIRENLEFYARATEVAKSQEADIIVFPEYGLFPRLSRKEMKEYLETVPDPDGNWNPCLQVREFSNRVMLHTLSCMARKNQIYIVVNVGDIEDCHEECYCPDDGALHHNANVVFDRDGTIISRYRKEHLFFEAGMDLPCEPQNSYFTTDFGSFAHFLSFDIIFKRMVEVAEDDRVDGIFLPCMWVDIMPVYHAVQLWKSWSIGNHVTLIVSNSQIPGASAVGSGVFTGHVGPLKYTYNADGISKLLVTRVPKSKNHTRKFLNPTTEITIITSNGTKRYNEDDLDVDSYHPEICSLQVLGDAPNVFTDYRCINEDVSNYTLVKLSYREDHIEACNNGMCCTLDYSVEQMNDKFYFGVYNGSFNAFNKYYWCTENCIVVRCEPHGEHPCSIFPTKSSTVFNRLHLSSNLTTSYVYPSVIRNGMRLAPRKEWNFNKYDHGKGLYTAHIDYVKRLYSKPILTAALFSRCYDRDPPYIR